MPGKFRFRSTPRAFVRRFAACPSGLRSGTTQSEPVRRRARVEQPGRDHAARALVAVDAADDEHARVPPPDPEGPDRPAERARAELRRGDAVPGKPDVEVVVVVLRQHLDDRRRAGETRARADEDLDGARGDEPVDELLREPAVDLPGPVGRPLAAVAAAGSRRPRRARSGATRGPARRSVRRTRRPAGARGRRSRSAPPRGAPPGTRPSRRGGSRRGAGCRCAASRGWERPGGSSPT